MKKGWVLGAILPFPRFTVVGMNVQKGKTVNKFILEQLFPLFIVVEKGWEKGIALPCFSHAFGYDWVQ